MSARKAITKKLRFEVFKRDAFKCQYCGKSAPDVILNVDHIKPVKDGGTNVITNLITSCQDCNFGKSAVPLDDNTVLEKQRKQLEELNERRLQLEMMMQWREGLVELEEDKVQFVAKKWTDLLNGHYSPNENGLKTIRKNLKKYDLNIILDSMEAAVNQYLGYDKNDKPLEPSVDHTWKMVWKIAGIKHSTKDKPYLKDLLYIRGILKNRLNYCNEREALRLLEEAYLLDASVSSMTDFAKSVKNWTGFVNEMERYIQLQKDTGKDEESE